MPVSYDHRAIFFHIPKTAGSSVERMLGLEFDRRTAHRLLLNHAGVDAYQHYLPVDVRRKLAADLGEAEGQRVFDDFTKFTVTRNPYDRVVSGYHFLLEKRHPLFFSSSFGRSSSRGHRRNVVDLTDKASVRAFFGSYLELAVECARKFAGSDDDYLYDKTHMLHHLRPQSHWFRPENLVYDAVIPYENISTDMPRFASEKLGCHAALPHVNARRSQINTSLSWKDHYDRNAIYLFEAVYGDDFNLADIVQYPRLEDFT
jgi:hypothetical protein